MKAWSGRGQTGKREYDGMQEAAVLADMEERIGRWKGTTVELIAARTGVEPRTVRAILSAHDGLGGVLVFDETQVYWAEFAEEAHGYTMKLKASIESLAERVERRQRGTAALARRQDVLFDG